MSDEFLLHWQPTNCLDRHVIAFRAHRPYAGLILNACGGSYRPSSDAGGAMRRGEGDDAETTGEKNETSGARSDGHSVALLLLLLLQPDAVGQ